MSTLATEPEAVLGLESAGLLMTPEEFDAIEEYDENYRYELINGVLVVSAIPRAEETGPNELLGYFLLSYKETHPRGSAPDLTLPQQYVRTGGNRRLADRLIWTGLRRIADRDRDLPSIAVEFVSAGRRNRLRDYVDKRRDYMQAGIQEYWIFDRFQRTLTVVLNEPGGPRDVVVTAAQTYESPLLPGFQVPLARLLEAADQYAAAKREN